MINKSNLLAILISGLLSSAAGAAQKDAAADCEAILKAFEGQRASGELTVGASEQGQINTDLAVLAEEHQLTELFAASDAKNLVMQRPLLVMSAAQKLLALIYSQGSSRIYLPGSPHQKTNFFPIFSDGLGVAGGVRVVAQYDAISRFVDTVEAQAVGDRSGNSPTLLEGPHGTGKSEFLKIIRAAYVGLTSPLKSPFATYSFEFRNLHKIPGLRTFLTIQKDPKTGEEYTAPWKAPLNHSPVSLLPEALQRELFNRASGKVAELTHGLVPIEPMQPDPHSKVIADQILLYYRSQLGGRELTNAETVAILNQYVTIKRVVFGQSAGTLPTVEFQGNDIDQRGLFVAPDPMIALTSGHGSAHPLAWNLAGKVLLSSGNVLLMDEILRNSEEFLNFMLGIMESRVVDLGGSPRVPFDTVFIAATNEANTNNAKKDPKLDATLDRFGKVRVVWPVRPHEVAETMLYMKKVGLVAKQLTGSTSASGEEGDGSDQSAGAAEVSLRNIFPLPQHDQPVLGPDGRYRLWYQKGKSLVDISPHALMFLSEIVAATRVKTNIGGFEEALAPYKVVNDPLFKSEIKRILLHEGRERVTASMAQELDEVVTKLSEGNTGISSRDAGRWLTRVLREANTPENHNTVTLDLVMRVFKRMLDEGAIRAPSIAEAGRWTSLARRVAKDITLPRLKGDIQTAIAADSSNLDSAYDDVFEELKALDEEPGVTVITRPGGATKSINQERLKFVREAFQKATGRPLSPGKILTAVHRSDLQQQRLPRHEGLWAAVRDYYADLETKRINIDSLYLAATTGEGNDELKQAARQLIQGMERLGYSEFAALHALETAKHWQDELAPKP